MELQSVMFMCRELRAMRDCAAENGESAKCVAFDVVISCIEKTGLSSWHTGAFAISMQIGDMLKFIDDEIEIAQRYGVIVGFHEIARSFLEGINNA